MKKSFLLLMVSILILSCKETKQKNVSSTEGDEMANTIYYGGNILTMETDSPTYAEAVVESDGKIVFVGAKEEAFSQYAENSNIIDLEGKTMLPAFLDAHGHFYNVGFTSLCANILPPPDGPGDDFESIINTMKEYQNDEAGKYMLSKTGWLIGNGYDDSQLKEGAHPRATDLDKISTEVPIIIIHQSGHLGAMNTKAIEVMKWTKDTKDPAGGVIRRDENGNPNGVLEENGLYAVIFPVLGAIDDEMAMKCIQAGQEEYAKKGYLTAQDGRTTPDQLAALKAAAAANKYFIDVVAYPDIAEDISKLEDGGYAVGDDYKNKFRIGGAKLTLDGSPQGKTAWLTNAYHVNPEGQTGAYHGYPVFEDEKAVEYINKAFKNKWQILVHCNGDAAIDQFIMAVDDAVANNGYEDHRAVLIHGQTLRKDQIPDLVRLNIFPSLFPMHTFYWGDWHRESVLGEERAAYISPARDVIDAGLKITSHHDAPVTFPNSMRVLDATVNRVTRTGKVLGPDQRITPYEGLKTLTDWAAYQFFEEDSKGTLTVGKLADFVILDKDPLKAEPLEINKIEILESIKEGKTVFKLN